MIRADDPTEAELRAAVQAAKAAYQTAVAAMTPEASLALMESPAGGPCGMHPVLTIEQREAQQLALAFRTADQALMAAKRALHNHHAVRAEQERQVDLARLRERTARKTAAQIAAGVPQPGQETRTPLPSGGRVR